MSITDEIRERFRDAELFVRDIGERVAYCVERADDQFVVRRCHLDRVIVTEAGVNMVWERRLLGCAELSPDRIFDDPEQARKEAEAKNKELHKDKEIALRYLHERLRELCDRCNLVTLDIEATENKISELEQENRDA